LRLAYSRRPFFSKQQEFGNTESIKGSQERQPVVEKDCDVVIVYTDDKKRPEQEEGYIEMR